MNHEYVDGASPIIKTPGGKWKLRHTLEKLLPLDVRERPYREAFTGGGAMFFHMQPKNSALSELVAPLATLYRVLRDNGGGLLSELVDLTRDRSKEAYLAARAELNAWLTSVTQSDEADARAAALFIYLNKCGFNGLYRFSQKGVYNVSWGKREDVTVFDEKAIRRASLALRYAHIIQGSYSYLIDAAEKGDTIFLDPPYVPISATANFTGYAGGADGWGHWQHEELATLFHVLDRRGCKLMLTNSDTPIVRELYDGFDMTELSVSRTISVKSDSRSRVQELVVRNVKSW